MTIGDVAEQTGLRTSALRYYEQVGLLEPAVRVSGHRRYDKSALDRLAVIQFCRNLDFSLAEIRLLLSEPRGARQKERWREFVDAKVDDLEQVVTRVRALEKLLLTSRDCDCVDFEECAKICA